MHWTFLLSAISASVVGQALLKAGAGVSSFVEQLGDWRTHAGLGIYGLSAILYIVALRRIPLSVALPCTALSYIAVALVGHYAFQEPLGLQRLLALALIGVGVVLLATS
jgi:small multidrug resistance pump